jgi:hypothetical protein
MALLETRIARDLHGNKKRKEQRVYYHRACKAWHITSKELASENPTDQRTVQEKPYRESSMD